MNLSYPEHLYIGFKKSNDEDIPLGFIADNLNSKTKATVDAWRSKEIETVICENTPVNGFKISDMTRRYSTSNVVFEITDPRGFNLQISAENLIFIIDEIGIEKGGVIKGDCFWCLNNGKAFLCSDLMGYTENLIYKRNNKPKKILFDKMKAGDTFILNDGLKKLTYIGLIYNYYGKKYFGGYAEPSFSVTPVHLYIINNEIVFSSEKSINVIRTISNETVFDIDYYVDAISKKYTYKGFHKDLSHDWYNILIPSDRGNIVFEDGVYYHTQFYSSCYKLCHHEQPLRIYQKDTNYINKSFGTVLRYDIKYRIDELNLTF